MRSTDVADEHRTGYTETMNRAVVPVLVCGLLSSWSTGALCKDGVWEEAASANIDGFTLKVSARSKGGSDIKEVRGVGTFDAPSWVVKNVIDDVVNYKNFMPYTKESTVVSKHDGYIVSYQRLATPVVDDRDYTIKIFDESREDVNGTIIWKNRWTEANTLGPPLRQGIARVGVNEGYWILESAAGDRTKATYYVYTNPGGSIPTFVINMANAQAVPELYRAVAKAARDPKYRQTRPKPRSSEKLPPVPPATLTAPPAAPAFP